jgi:hypothetical protein
MKKKNGLLDRKTTSKLCLEASKYSLDLSKLVFGGVILSGIMGMNINRIYLLSVGFITVFLTAMLGLILFVLGNKK